MVWSIVIAAAVAYLIVMFMLHKLFEKFFIMLLFIVSSLFVLGVLYFAFRGFA